MCSIRYQHRLRTISLISGTDVSAFENDRLAVDPHDYGARRRAEEGPLWGSDPGGARRAGLYDAPTAGCTVASPRVGPLLRVSPAPRQVAHVLIPILGRPSSTHRQTPPRGLRGKAPWPGNQRGRSRAAPPPTERGTRFPDRTG